MNLATSRTPGNTFLQQLGVSEHSRILLKDVADLLASAAEAQGVAAHMLQRLKDATTPEARQAAADTFRREVMNAQVLLDSAQAILYQAMNNFSQNLTVGGYYGR